jgi:AAA domain
VTDKMSSGGKNVNVVLSQLSVRHAVQSERYLVGRNELLRSLVGCYEGEQRSFAWLYGARRIGKSSVAQSVIRQAARKDTSAIYVDAGGVASFGELVASITRAAGTSGDNTLNACKDPVGALEALVRTAVQRPLLLVIDEADCVALNLRVVEQATFRRLAHEENRFACLFVSRSNPASLVEEVPDVNSRLLGICNQRRVKPLLLVDIEELCGRVGEDLGCDLPRWLAARIWENVGGISVAIMSAVHAVAVRLVEGTEVGERDFDELLESELCGSVRRDIQGFWWDLDPECRLGLLAESASARQERRLREQGMVHRARVVKPLRLLEEAHELGVAPPGDEKPSGDVALVETMFSLLVAVNNRLKLNKYNEGFRVTTDTVKFFVLTRATCTEEDLSAAVDYLYAVFFEGARDRKGNREYLLPCPLDELYKTARVVGDISDIRNFLRHSHGRPTDYERRNISYQEAGDIFDARTGSRDLSTDDERRRFRRSLIEDLVSVLQRIYDRLDEITHKGSGTGAVIPSMDPRNR